MGRRIEVKKGEKYGRLEVIKEISPWIGPKGNKARKFLCKCECGNDTDVFLNALRSGKSKSCGCLHKERVTKEERLTDHPLYKRWEKIKDRCYNPNSKAYKYYRGKGIKMCDDWLNSENFLSWAEETNWNKEPGLTLDRIDGDGDYSPENCRWVNKYIQAYNKERLNVSKSGVTGVTKIRHKWRAHLMYKGEYYLNEYYYNFEDAVLARMKAEKEVEKMMGI